MKIYLCDYHHGLACYGYSHVILECMLSWSILGLVDLYDAIWGGEYQNDLGVAIAS